MKDPFGTSSIIDGAKSYDQKLRLYSYLLQLAKMSSPPYLIDADQCNSIHPFTL